MRLVVFGKNGQVASALRSKLTENVIFLSSQDVDFTNPEEIKYALDLHNPEIIINTAAYTAVDKAETEQAICFKVNADAPREIAAWCGQHKALLIHFSTEYVYSGEGDAVQTEESPVGPKNFYGLSKLKGEEFIKSSGANYIILRTSWVYDEKGSNFVRTMLKLGKERKDLKIVSDQIGSPTYAADLANAVDLIIKKTHLPIQKTYNICGTGHTSWFDFAQEIFKIGKELGFPLSIQEVHPIHTSEYKTPAIRPLNSRVSTDKLNRDFGLTLPEWKKSLRVCLENMEHS